MNFNTVAPRAFFTFGLNACSSKPNLMQTSPSTKALQCFTFFKISFLILLKTYFCSLPCQVDFPMLHSNRLFTGQRKQTPHDEAQRTRNCIPHHKLKCALNTVTKSSSQHGCQSICLHIEWSAAGLPRLKPVPMTCKSGPDWSYRFFPTERESQVSRQKSIQLH